MNTYKVSFSLFSTTNNTHFSNCKAEIEGNTFEEAVTKFKEEKFEEGWHVDFIVEGDNIQLTSFNLDEGVFKWTTM